MLISGLQCVLQYHEQASDSFLVLAAGFAKGSGLHELREQDSG